MIVLPSLLNYIRPRPNRPKFEENIFVPDFNEYSSFWEEIHKIIYALSAEEPITGDLFKKIDESFGFFGNRIHPITHEPHYFHSGVEIGARAKQKVRPLLNGILEYSGFSITNGYYVLLSHPYIQTEDGYILHTMYCHLKKPLVKFSSYQKMLREISLGSYPLIEITKDIVLGLVGSSGDTIGDKPKLYLQCDFRKFNYKPIVIDPMYFFSNKIHINKSRHKSK